MQNAGRAWSCLATQNRQSTPFVVVGRSFTEAGIGRRQESQPSRLNHTTMNTPTLWNPLREFETMQERVLRALNLGSSRASGDGQQSLTTAEWAPVVDISEDENEYLIKAELPEVAKEDVKITVENGVLTLKGERHFEAEKKDKKYHRVERGYGSFMRTFSMPDDADPDKITAEFKDGLLRVTLAKSEAKKPKQIEVLVN